MDFSAYSLIISASVIIILSYFFGEISRKTNIPSVLMLIMLGIGVNIGLESAGVVFNFKPYLEVLGIVGLIMIVLEAALELELTREKIIPIVKALSIALIGLMASTWVAAIVLQYFFPDMNTLTSWIYATPLSILSSAIIIPSVSGLSKSKKEFHIYESTFSDILGIMLFYFLTGQLDAAEGSSGLGGFSLNLLLTLALSFIASYLILFVFQNIRSSVKLFLLISVLLLLYAVGKQFHLSSLIIILIFGLLISNVELFYPGKMGALLDKKKAHDIYEGLHVVTMETAFVVRTFFFVFFGLTISLSTLASLEVALVSGLIILSIYVIRFVMLRVFFGKDIIPQVFIGPRGLITVLLFYNIPKEVELDSFDPGVLLFIIIATSLIMTFAMIYDKRRTGKAVRKAQGNPVGVAQWKAPTLPEENGSEKEGH